MASKLGSVRPENFHPYVRVNCRRMGEKNGRKKVPLRGGADAEWQKSWKITTFLEQISDIYCQQNACWTHSQNGFPCIGKEKSFNEDEVLNQAVEFWASSVSSGKQKEAQILWRAGSVSLLVMLYSQYTFFFGRVGPDFLKVISYFYRTRVRSLAMLVTHWLTNSLTHSVTFPIIGYACH